MQTKEHPSIKTIITEFNVPTPGAQIQFNCSQIPPHLPGRGVVGHYFDRCIIYIIKNDLVLTFQLYVLWIQSFQELLKHFNLL